MVYYMSDQQRLDILLRSLWAHIEPVRRIQLIVIGCLILLSTVAEIASIGSVVPFLGVLTAPERIFEHSWAQPLITGLGLTEPKQLLLTLTVFFGLAATFSGAVRFALLWGQTRLGNAIGVDLGSAAYRRTLYQPYIVHATRNSSEVVVALITKINTVIYYIIIPFLMLATSVFIVFVTVVIMIWIEPKFTLATFLGLGLMYAIVAYIARKLAAKESQRVSVSQSQVTKVVQEGLGGIRDVLIDGLQETYFNNYRQADNQQRRALTNITILSGAPRPVIESLGVVLIGTLAYFLACRPEGMSTAIPVLGAMALAAQRLLPLVQQGYSSWTSIHGGKASLCDVLELLGQPLPAYITMPPPSPISFRQHISLNKLHYRYAPQATCVLRGVNLTISRGSKVGFIGETGSGKSTLLDIIMGLLYPTSGTLSIDGNVVDETNYRAWQMRIAHVPQSIYLADTSIEENIAFGFPLEKIDRARVCEAAQRAQISDTIESWPQGYNTFVGERGIRLSGGQCQRIGIARALYKQVDVIVFDEATSALDSDTENSVMEAIDQLGGELTILIVAHRLTTLKNCDQIVKLCGGAIQAVGTYNEMIVKNAEFKLKYC